MKPSRAPSPVPPDSSAPLDFPSRAAFNNSRPGSRSGGSLRRVVLVLLLFFGALELFTRFKLVPMSKDLRRFQTYLGRAARLHAAPGLHVAFVGNSATERAIDLPVWQRALNRQYPTSLDVFTADASHINAWQPIANHLFWSPGQAPDVLIVPFFNRSLEDGNELEIGRLAQFFTSPREMPRALGELPDTGAQIDFLLSSVWATYATRTRLKERVLSLLVPDYRGFTEELQGSDSQASQASPGATASPAPRVAPRRAPTYRHLEQLARDARASHCRLIFVALPWRDAPYPIAPTLVARLKAAGAFWLDLRHAPGLTPRLYEDSIHLSPQGRRVFTAQFLPALAPLLRAASARPLR